MRMLQKQRFTRLIAPPLEVTLQHGSGIGIVLLNSLRFAAVAQSNAMRRWLRICSPGGQNDGAKLGGQEAESQQPERRSICVRTYPV